ncbi:p60 katanin, putative [Eimeria brunetti]|uniref:p60 katanin, putative n=1 Tax=Eimeria brunetti TaxID=51314 RepID=U6LK04_9EIME|nr:p60 katanin, putative [Eimeria brunetti]
MPHIGHCRNSAYLQRKLTERGRLKVVSSSSGYLAIDGCTAGFCIASYEGTKEEQAVLQGGLYTVEAVFKVLPGGAFDGQAVCILLDLAKAGDVTGVCDFCSLQINTSASVEDESRGNGEYAADLVQLIETELVWPAPGISFEDIVALSSAKDALRESVLLPLQMPNVLTGLLEPPKGIMLFGPPGTGVAEFESALQNTRPSVSADVALRFIEWDKEFGSR